MLSAQERKFIESRRRLVGPGFHVLLGASLLPIIMWLLFYVRAPHLVDPFSLAQALAQGSVERSTLEVLALLSPVMLAMVVFCLFAALFLAAFALRQERRYLDLIERLAREAM
jgi:hypothetical protein